MTKKDNSIELLRLFAILAVVMIHTTSTSLSVSGYYLHNTPVTFFLNQITRFAVPLFFLISGYVLQLRYPKIINISLFYKKRATRLILPFAIWSFIYYVLVYHAGIKAFFTNFPNLLLLGSAAEHLYFIPSLIVLYLIFPILNYFVNLYSPNKYPLYYFIFVSLNLVFLFVDYYIAPLPLATPLRIALLNLPVFIIGMVWSVEKNSVEKSLTKPWIFFLSLLLTASALLVIFEGNILSFYGKYLGYLMSQWRPSVFIYTLCIFVLGMLFLKKKQFTLPSFFSKTIFFVYFIHIIYIHFFWKAWGAYLFSHSNGHIVEQIWFDPLVFCFVVICSYASAFVISKIPIVRYMLGVNK